MSQENEIRIECDGLPFLSLRGWKVLLVLQVVGSLAVVGAWDVGAFIVALVFR